MKLFLYNNRVNFKKLFKEKLKDRHKVKGIKFDYSKKEEKKYLLSQNEKSQEEIMRKVKENLLFQNYNKLKHQIFIREQKENEISKKESINNKISTSFNYTNLKNIVEKYFSEKNNITKDNPFSYNVKKGKLALEQMNRNMKKNRIHTTLKKIVLHFTNIKSKLKTGLNEERKNYLSEEEIEKIKNRIQTQRKRMNSRNKIANKNKSLIVDSHNENNSSKNSNLTIINNKEQKHMIDVSNYNESHNNKSNINNTLKLTTFRPSLDKKNEFKKNKYSSSKFQFYKKIINSEIQNPKKETNLKYGFIKDETNLKNSYGKSQEHIFEKKNTNLTNKKLSSKSINLNCYSNLSLNSKKESNGKKRTFEPSLILTDDYNTIGLMKKYNSEYVKKNYKKKHFFNRQKSCINLTNKNNFRLKYNESSINNKNLVRSSSSIKKKSFIKVTNKPIYTTNINDFVLEYNRIKKNIKNLKNNYKEKHFSTYKEIDNLLEVKEDMLMFLLKQKFLSSKFKPKQNKMGKTKKDFMNKLKDYMEILEENPNKRFIKIEDFFKL